MDIVSGKSSKRGKRPRIHRTGVTATNLFNLLRAAADAKPEAPFFYYGAMTTSYAQALSAVVRLSGAFEARGIGRGDRVIIQLGNSPAFIYGFLALSRLGAIAVPVNPAARRYELRRYVELCEPRALITTADRLDDLCDGGSYILPKDAILPVDTAGEFVLPAQPPVSDRLSVDAVAVTKDEPAAIIYTSAMDGCPLGALITHRGILETARASADIFARQNDVFITVLPLFHAFGLSSSLFIPLHNKAPLHLLGRFSPKAIMAALDAGATVFAGVPAMYTILASAFPEGARFPRMRIWISGGESISTRTQATMMERFGIDIRQGYGLTEASPIVTWNIPGRPNRHGTIGVPMPYNQVRIIDHGNDCAPGRIGEIIVKGVNVVPGYYRRPDASAIHIVDGWLHTGDTGYCDADGYFHITGRLKDMVIRRGFNVYPREVEALILHHPSIKSVRVSGHSIPEPDSTFTESIEAEIMVEQGRNLSVEALRAWCRENISSYKIPDTFTIHSQALRQAGTDC